MSRAGPTDDLEFEPGAMLETLVRHEVRFVVIGGIAGNAHGSTSATLDLDVCHARDDGNIRALGAALSELAVTLPENGPTFTFHTRHGRLDCLGDASGYTYEILAPNAERVELGGVEVLISSLDDLIRMKRAAGRLKDLVEVENLSKLRDVREEAAPYRVAARRSPVQARPRVRR